MTKIAFIIPYFGKLPNYFVYWLESVRMNSSIDFILLTDDKTQYKYPDNVKVFYMDFDSVRNLIQSKFDFPISLENPYKLCDYKSAYGYIFSCFLKDYDFWGHCDIDLIFGNIRSFFTEKLLNSYDKLLTYGHCELYRNVLKINQNFMKDNPPYVSYKVVFSSPAIWAFDESTSPINRSIWSSVRLYDADVFVDLWPRYKNLIDSKKKKRCIFFLQDGDLFEVYDSGERRVMYVHFKERMVYCNKGNGKYLVLTPNGIGYTDCLRDQCYVKESSVRSVWKYNFFAHYKKIIKNASCLLYFVLFKKYPRSRFLMWSRLSLKDNWEKFTKTRNNCLSN